MLTTRCPHCTTMFRIRPEQLSVRGGRVRCGHCHQAFSALASLEELPEDELPAGPTEPAETSAHLPPASPAMAADAAGTATGVVAYPAPVSAPVSAPHSAEPTTQNARAIQNESESPAVPGPGVEGNAVGQEAVAIPIEPFISDVRLELPEPPQSEPEFIPADTTGGLEITWMAMDEDEPATGTLQPAPSAKEAISSERFTLPGDIKTPPAAARAKPVEVPANEVGADNGFAADAGAAMDFDLSKFDEPDAAAPEPGSPQAYKSKIAAALGIEPYDPGKENGSGFTVLLEDSVELPQYETISPEEVPHGAVERPPKPRVLPWALGVLLLVLLATVQAAFFFRTDLARVLPQTRPLLEAACRVAGCAVPYPREAELIIVESSSLNPESGADGRFRLTVSLHNKAAFAQAWPYLELTLTDRFDIAIARRVLTPAEWLPAANAARPAFDSRDDITASLNLTVGSLPAAGYRLYAFYP